MPRPQNQRNKLLNFRVSEDEYRQIEEAMQNVGARNISDFCRQQVLADSKGYKLDMILAILTSKETRLEASDRRITALEQQLNVTH